LLRQFHAARNNNLCYKPKLNHPNLTHRHPAYWDEPEKFDLDRFLPERAQPRQHYAYFPFGAGQRKGIGNNFSLEESVMILATLAQRYRLRVAPDENAEPQFRGTLRPQNGLRMSIERRN
jgi:cytochrome P450